MYIVAFFLLIFSLLKILLIIHSNFEEVTCKIFESIDLINIAAILILADGIIGAICGLYILI